MPSRKGTGTGTADRADHGVHVGGGSRLGRWGSAYDSGEILDDSWQCTGGLAFALDCPMLFRRALLVASILASTASLLLAWSADITERVVVHAGR